MPLMKTWVQDDNLHELNLRQQKVWPLVFSGEVVFDVVLGILLIAVS